MAKKALINVVDVEATCGDDVETSEIIQIGIVAINLETDEMIQQRRVYVKPICSEITKFCTELTGITKADVQSAPLFEEAMNGLFDEFKLSRRPWVSWGDYDREAFVKMGHLYHTRYYFGKTHTNLKNTFAMFSGLQRGLGLRGALDRLGMDFEGSQHDGLDDAINIARVLLEMKRRITI